MNDPRNWAIGCLGAIVLCCILVCGPLFIGTNLLTGGIGTGLGFMLDAEEPAEVRVVEQGYTEKSFTEGPQPTASAETATGNILLQSGYFTHGGILKVNLVFSEFCPQTVDAPAENWHYEGTAYSGSTRSTKHITSGNLLDDRFVEWKALNIGAAPSCNYALQ